MEAPVFVKGPAGQYTSDLVQACEEHFSKIYPEYVDSSDHDTVMCPSAFPFGYIAPTGQASGATPVNNMEKASTDGDNAELKIFHMLEKFGKETNQPMFVLAQVKITEFIKNVLRQKLPADHPILSSDKLSNLDGETDFLIIHRQIGVILIEVKAPKKFSKSAQSKAKKQLRIGEEIIHALSHVDHKTDYKESTIHVYKVIAMPNVSEPGRENRENFISLREENVQSVDNFVHWWENKFATRAFGAHEKRELQNLICIFIGQKSEVSSKVLSDVCKKIDEQKFLQKSYEWGTKQREGGSQVVLKTVDQPEQAIFAKQILFLNPEQLRIWSGPRQQFFNGSSGSGKTILLQFKALECAKQGQKVVVVVPSSLTSLYKNFFAKKSISSGVEVLSPSGISELFQRCGDPAVKFHFFADELQAFEAEAPQALTKLGNLLCQIAEFDCYCWVAYDYMQRNVNENEASRDETGGLIDALTIEAKAHNLCKTHDIYHAPCLTTIVRSTFEVYTFVQKFVKENLLDLLQRLKLPQFDDTVEKETKEMFTKFVENYEKSNHLGHHICGPSVTELNVKNSGLDFISKVVQKEINAWAGSASLHRVAVLVTTSFPKERLGYLMAQKGIAVCDIADNKKNAVVLDFGRKAHSYEWPVVVAISWFNNDPLSNYIMFTRAVSRLVVIKNKDVP